VDRFEPAAGPLASLRALVSTLLEMVGTRAELALVELREETARRERTLALACVAALFLALGLLLAALLVVVAFWETHRVAAAGAMTGLYLGIAAAAFAKMRAARRADPAPFEATLRELALDREALRAGGRDD
jgi:uncharacterized membrane protein YqjE